MPSSFVLLVVLLSTLPDQATPPPEARYLQALTLLRPHLTWHAAYPPAQPRNQLAVVEKLAQRIERAGYDPKAAHGWLWDEAHRGEEWMYDDVPREKLRQAREDLKKHMEEARTRRQGKVLQQPAKAQPAEVGDFFWRLKDRQHADVQRAVKLLEGIHDGPTAAKARHWLAEIERNNTVLTMDVAGCYSAGKAAPVVIDVRNAERLTARLYRVRRPETLLHTAARIGEDFIYRDYGLQAGELDRARQLHDMRAQLQRDLGAYRRAARRRPQLEPGDLLTQWDVDVAQLEVIDCDRQWQQWCEDGGDDEDEYDADEAYFGDSCEQFRPRLKKTYWPGWERLSSWQCDRVLEVPGDALKEAGAYVLVLEANGQTAYAPIVVDALSLTMRRCRDGVFCLVSDADNRQPLAGARVLASSMLGEAVTNAEGVYFARTFAAGHQPIVVQKDDRYAVGGFGAVFEGIYRTEQQREYDNYGSHHWARKALDIQRPSETVAQVYTDRYLVAALTDRPTYRPGQTAELKLIVRRLPPAIAPTKIAADGKSADGDFRAGEFDWGDHLEVPEINSAVEFQVLNPAGRIVHTGSAMLNDYGTAAASIPLSSEAKVGSYTLRVTVGGMDRILPEAFAVRWYRRPNFELTVAGLPEVVKPAERLQIHLEGRYYFGKPVAAAKANVRLVQPGGSKPLVDAAVSLDSSGMATVTMSLPDKIAPGEYRLIAALTDGSGRTVTSTAACRVEGPPMHEHADDLSALARFIPAGEVLSVKTPAPEVVVTWQAKNVQQKLSFPAHDGVATVKLPGPGWYLLIAGPASRRLFAFGGDEHPLNCHEAMPKKVGDPDRADAGSQDQDLPRWVDLSDYRAEEDQDVRGNDPDRDVHLFALFDRQQARVGDKLRVLVYAPSGAERLLLTIEGRTVIDYLVARPGGKACYHVIEIPIKRRYLPNFYLQGRVLAECPGSVAARALREQAARLVEEIAEGDGSEDPRWCRVDVIDPAARLGGSRLNVAIETNAATYRPGERVGVRIRTSDLTNTPCEAEVSLAAVDESMFSFGEDRADLLPQFFADPHPERAFLRKKWRASYGAHLQLQMRAKEMEMALAQQAAEKALDKKAAALDRLEKIAEVTPPPVMPVSAVLLPGELPVANISLARLRSDFRETAAWQPQLRTDRNGLLETSFVLPDSLTRYRLTGVGLTRQAEIGVGRTRVTATMPLSVQLFLPRFAVEQDRLEAVGLLHNNSKRARTCQVTWEISGAQVALAAGQPQWQTESRDNKWLVRGAVQVAAGQSARVALGLVIERLGDVGVSLRAGEADESDAEQRTLSVQPLGRSREVALVGTFLGQHELTLPAGFVATDFRLSLARSDVAGALDGLGYLIDYPYGCVEQTMSRFLPAVMVKRAAQEAGIALPPEAAAKLPDVLHKSLERLYNFQHPDGSWGWWENDAANDGMSIYVVYGLARCRSTGTEVAPAVLDSGCNFLLARLKAPQMSRADRAAACLALALAGRAQAGLLRAEVQAGLAANQPDTTAACLALACRIAGLREPGERLFARMRQWQPSQSDDIAQWLALQVAFGAPLDECRTTAAKLLARRSGQHWESTRATSWALEALAQMLRYDVARPKPGRLVVSVDGKTVLDLARPEDLDTPVYRLRLDRASITAQEGAAVRMRVEGGVPVTFTLNATGTQRLDHLEPEGNEIKLTRKLTALDGRPLDRRIKLGDVIAVHLGVELSQPQSYVIIEDRRPAGCEFADEQLDGPAVAHLTHFEFRDDRVCAFAGGLPAGKHELVYYLRAETRGTSNVLPGEAYPMYHDSLRGTTGGLRLVIE